MTDEERSTNTGAANNEPQKNDDFKTPNPVESFSTSKDNPVKIVGDAPVLELFKAKKKAGEVVVERPPVRTAHSTEVRMHKMVDSSYAVKSPAGTVTVMTGNILKLMDTCACLSAESHAGFPTVTASMDDLVIINNPYEGELLLVKGKVNRAFNTSMEVGVIVTVYNFDTDESRPVCTAYFTFLAHDGDGRKVKLPLLLAETDDEKRRYEMAFERRQIRISRKSKISDMRETEMMKNASITTALSGSDKDVDTLSLASLDTLAINTLADAVADDAEDDGHIMGIKIHDQYRRESLMSPYFASASDLNGKPNIEPEMKLTADESQLREAASQPLLVGANSEPFEATRSSGRGKLADLQINTKDLKAKADKVNLSPPMSPMTMRRGSPDLSPLNSVSPQAHPTQSISDGVDKVLMARTAIEHIEILLPQHTQHHGTAFGGQIMQWMAETGFISAHRVITDTPVLKSVDDVHFINPGHLGERIHIFCQVNRSFNQSCEVGVRIEAFPIGEKPRHINSAFLTFVSKGSLPARSVIVTNEMEERRYLDAASRRKVAIDRAVLRSKERNLTVPFDTNTRADIIASNVRGLMHLVQSKSGWEKGVSSETETWNVYMKQQAGRTCIKAQGTLPHPASQMFETVRAMPLRPLWDPIYSESIVVEILDEFNYICLQRLKETKSTPAQELLVLVSVRQLGEVGGNYVFAFRSIDHADYPVQKDTIRAEIYSGGFVVQPIDAESCQFWYLQNGMTDSIMQYIAADFIGFSNTIGYTMNCLVNFQERLYVQKEWQVVHDMAKEVLKERLKLVEVYSHMENRTPDQELELTYRRASMTTMVMAMVRLRDMEARSQPLDTKRKLTDSLLAPLSPRSESTLRLARKSVGRIQTLFRKDSRKGSVPDAKHE